VKRALIVMILLSAQACSKKDITDFYIRRVHASLPGQGLSESDGRINWTMNAGIYYDSDMPSINRARIEPLLAAASLLARKEFPDVEVRTILDQPQDGQYMLNMLTRDKKALSSRQTALVLQLDSSKFGEEENRETIAKAGRSLDSNKILHEIAALQSVKNLSGQPALADKNVCSVFLWDAYFHDQVRYDLIFTNAILFQDSLKDPAERRENADGSLIWKIFASPGRSAMENNAAVFSLYRMEDARAAQEIADLLLILVLATDQAHLDAMRANRPMMLEFQKKRLAYLKSVLAFQNSGRCEGFSFDFSVDPVRREAMEAGLEHLQRYCDKKKD